MKTLLRQTFPLLFLAGFLYTAVFGQAQDAAASGKGAIIIVSVEGDVKIKKVGTDVFLPQESVAAGKSIFDGHTFVTGDASKAVLLLSNGSITTVGAKSELTIAEFSQKKFEKSDAKMAELEAEPSNSTTKLKLGYGDMTFNVKKLNPGSSFEIDSPVGNAGIRGTAGQMTAQIDPNTGNFSGGCNMTQGTVSFTDPSGNSIPLNAGQGTNVTTDSTGQQVGETEQQDVPAETQQEINQTTQEAESESEDITVDQAGSAVEEVEQQAAEETQPTEDEPAEDEPKEDEPKEDEPTDEPSDEPSDEPADEPSDEPAPSDEPSDEPATTEPETTTTDEPAATTEPEPAPATEPEVDTSEIVEQNLETNETVEIIQETGEVVETDSELAKAINSLGLSSDLKKVVQDYTEDTQWKITEQSPAAASHLMEANPTETEILHYFAYSAASQEAVVNSIQPAQTQTLLGHSLQETQVTQILGYGDSSRDALIDEPTTRLQGLLAYGLDTGEADQLFTYSADLRQSMVDADNVSLVKALLLLAQSEEITSATLADYVAKRQAIDQEDPTTLAPDTEDVVSTDIEALLESTRAKGNDHIIDYLYTQNDGKITPELLAIGQLGNDLLTDSTIDGQLDASRFFGFQDATGNVFYQDVTGLFDAGILPTHPPTSGLTGKATSFPDQLFASRTLTILPGALDLSNHLDSANPLLLITAVQDIQLDGTVDFTASSLLGPDTSGLALGAGGKFNIAPGSSLLFQDGSLALASKSSSEFVQVSMQAAGELSIGSLENLVFQDSSLQVRPGDSIHLEAMNTLSINGLQLSDQLQSIYMQAITIDLRNVFFPDGSMVHLQSQFGGYDGIYPNFGDSQPGRVNFIENVGYHQTVIDNRAIFDQFSDKITITPLGGTTAP